MSRETVITSLDDVPAVRIAREFDAPPEAVFRAHTDVSLFVRWIGPRGLETTIDVWDCRTGGAYRYLQREGDEVYAFRGCFHEVRPAEVLVQTFAFEGFPDGVALERLTLEALPSGRSRLVTVSLMDSFEARDAMVASGMEHGVREGYEKLDDVLRRWARAARLVRRRGGRRLCGLPAPPRAVAQRGPSARSRAPPVSRSKGGTRGVQPHVTPRAGGSRPAPGGPRPPAGSATRPPGGAASRRPPPRAPAGPRARRCA